MTRDDFPEPPAAHGPTGNSIVLGGGCFWCVDAVYRALRGVTAVESGYAGGTAETANYTAVCKGTTGHVEVVRVGFDPATITLGLLLKVFFSVAHDPTQHNRQGNDRGTQYRSVVFYANDAARDLAARYIALIDGAHVFPTPISTTVEPLVAFYPAETYHQDYATQNPHHPYIQHIAQPKVEKLRLHFAPLLNAGQSSRNGR